MAKTIEDYKKDFAAAQAKGDAAGMQAANNGANAIRASTGQKAEYAGQAIANAAARSGGNSTDYSATIYSPTASYGDKVSAYNARYAKEQQMKSAGTWNNSWASTDSLKGILDNMLQPQSLNPYADIASQYGRMQEDNNALAAKYYKQYVKQGTDRLNAQRSSINTSYDDAARQAYINYQQQQKATPQQMAALGMTGGAAESSLIQQQSAYQGNLSGFESARNKAQNDISTAITELQNSGDLQTAQYILANADKISEAYLSGLNSDIGRRDNLAQQAQQNAYNTAALTGIYNGNPTLDAQQIAYGQQQDAYSKALQLAQITNDYSSMKQYGWSDAQIRSANLANAPTVKGGSGGGSSGRSSSGYLPAVDYGDDYEEETAATQAPKPSSDLTSLGANYSTVWNNARRMFDSGKSADEIAKYLDMFDEGQLSDSGMEKILKSLNLYGVRGG